MDAATLAEAAAANFTASLGVEITPHDHALIFNAYIMGWIDGAHAGANEHRPGICESRTTRRLTVCNHNAKGQPW